MTKSSVDRRHLLKLGGAFSVLGGAAPFALQLAAAGSAAGQQAPDYRALVCVFLYGGNDANNMLLATDNDSWTRYFAARNTGANPIGLMPVGVGPTAIGQTSSVTGRVVSTSAMPEAWGGVLPITPRTPQPIPAGTNATERTFGLHPMMGPVKRLFDARRLAIVANVGTLTAPVTKAHFEQQSGLLPANLFSHNDQQSTWQANAGEGAREGWGGQMADALASLNGASTLFTAISVAGNAVFLSGRNVTQYQLSTSGTPAVEIQGAAGPSLLGSSLAPTRLREIIRDTGGSSAMANDYSDVVIRSMASASSLNATFTNPMVANVAAPSAFTNPITGTTEPSWLAVQLHTVAQMIAASASLGLRRQVFFVGLGGWDTHDFQNNEQPALLAQVAHGLAYFDTALSNIGGVDRRSSVTTFTASDFSRTFTTNGDGTDHAWGSHHLVMGGAVKGGDIYGQYPTLGADVGGFNNPDMSEGVLIPTTSVDQYAATLGAWFGVSATDLAAIFPRLGTFSSRNLGFV